MLSTKKKVKYICVAAALCCSSALPFAASAEEDGGYTHLWTDPYVKTVYNEQNGLPTGEANTVLQTKDGYIWIGSYGGLVRYDGSAFRNFSTDGSISSSSIRSLFEDSSGNLWIGTNDAGVFKYDNSKFIEIESPGDYSFTCIRDFAEDGSGRIYAASTSGLCEIKDGALAVYDDEELAGETVYSIACDPFGRVWAVMNSGKCAVVSDGKTECLIDSESIFDSAEIYCVASDDSGGLYLGSSSNEMAVLSFEDDKSYNAKICDTGYATTHNRISANRDGSKVIVCGEHGFSIMNKRGELLFFDDEDPSVSINDAGVDYEGNIWLASSSYGVLKYSPGCIYSAGSGTEAETTAFNAVTKADGRIYAAHDNGLIILDEDGRSVKNELTKLLSGVRVRHAMTDSSGRVWLSTYSDNGAICYDPSDESMTFCNTENGLISNLVRLVYEMSDGSFAIATQEGVNIVKDGKVIGTYNSDNGLAVSSILCLAQDSDGTLYMGSDGGGIYSLKDGVITNHGFEEELEEGVVLRMLADSDSDGYFISAGSNLYYWDKSKFRKLENFRKGAGSIFDFYDRDDMLWLLQNNGIIALDKEALLGGEFIQGREYSFKHGLTGSLNANTWNFLDSDGKLYISTRSGISVFGFNGLNTPLPNLVINGITVDGNAVDYANGNIDIPGEAQRITVDFAALSYTGTEDYNISYMLEGFDSEETVLIDQKSGSISYTNLPGGKYNFVINVFPPDDPSTAQSLTLFVNKAKQFYEYPLFWAAAVLLLLTVAGVVMYLIYAVRLRAARRRQESYRRIVEQSLQTFAGMIDAKDKYTNGHSLRVAAYSRELAKRMGLDSSEQERIYYIALLHDIGKIGIPDNILNKPGRLTDEEMNIIRTHPAIGGRILKNFTALEGISQGARYHHERFDGKGYCEGKAGYDIPLEARIIGVADTYDAMSSDRCYRKALTRDVIEEELKKVSGTQLDPDIIPHMLSMIEDGFAPVKETSDVIGALDKERK